jgi:hypothetical protein
MLFGERKTGKVPIYLNKEELDECFGYDSRIVNPGLATAIMHRR